MFSRRYFTRCIAFLSLATALWADPAFAQVSLDASMPNPNGYDLLIQATELYKETPGTTSEIMRFGPDTSPVPLKVRQRFIRNKAAALNLARESSKMEYRNPPVRSSSTLFPQLATFRELARAFSLEADIYAETGKPGRAISSSLDCIAMGVQIPHGGVLIHYLVGLACESIGRQGIWKRVPAMDAQTARSAARRLESLEGNHVSLRQVWLEEKESGIASLRENLMNQMKENANPPIVPPPPIPEPGGQSDYPSQNTLPPPLTEARVEDYLHRQSAYYEAIIAATERPFSENTEQKINTFYTEGDGKLPPGDNRIPVSLMPVTIQVREKAESTRAENALLTVAIALQAYHAAQYDFPPDLTALTRGPKKYLLRLPLDPFAETKPVRYRRISPDHYLLYSVGPDGNDDKGKPLYNENSELQMPSEIAGKPIHNIHRDLRGDIVVGVNFGPESLGPLAKTVP